MKDDIIAESAVAPGCALHGSIEVLDSSNLKSVSAHVKNQIDELGRESAEAQDLTAPITSTEKLASREGDRLYALLMQKDSSTNGVESQWVAGYLKVGRRHLFLFPPSGKGRVDERDVLCVLDFVVTLHHRRQGCGRALFDAAISAEEDIVPARLAYDRPSAQMVHFLERQYDLSDLEMQPNRFAIHTSFW